MPRSPANSEGTEHLYVHPDQPEAAEVRELAAKMRGVNVDHVRRARPIFNPDPQQPVTANARAAPTAGQALRGQQVATAYADSAAMEGRAGTSQALQQARTNLTRQNQVAP